MFESLFAAAVLGAAGPVTPPPATSPTARAATEARGWFTPAPGDATRAVVFELRVLTLHDDPPAGVTLRPGTTTLTDAQVRALVKAAQLDRRGNMLAAPRVTVIDGQTADVMMGGTRTFTTGVEAVVRDGQVAVVPKTRTVDVGTRLGLTGRVAADGKTVTARLKYTDTRVGDAVPAVPLNLQHGDPPRLGVVVLEAPMVDTVTIETTAELTAGRHAVVAGPTRMVEHSEVYETPVLSRIPYVSRLFTNVGISRVPVRTYLVLSATVIEDEPDVPVAPAPRPAGR